MKSGIYIFYTLNKKISHEKPKKQDKVIILTNKTSLGTK